MYNKKNMSIFPLTVPPKRLAQTISSTDMAFKLNNIRAWDGQDLTPGDFGTEAYCTFINPTRTRVEIFKIDPATIADGTITVIARGLGYSGGDISDPSRQYPWVSNETIIQLGTDAPQLFRDFMSETNPQTVQVLHEYEVLPQSAETPTLDEEFVTKKYVDDKTGSALAVPVTQVAHGFVVGDLIYASGTNTYAKAQADNVNTSEVVGIVNIVEDADNFSYTTEGVVTVGVPDVPAGTVLFLSPDTAGELTDVEPITVGQVVFPLAVVTEPEVSMVFHKYRPNVINTIAGNPIASETIAGIVEQATEQEVEDGTDIGDTGAPLFVVPSLIGKAVKQQKVEFLVSEQIQGLAQPQAIMLDAAGSLTRAKADAVTRAEYLGFVTKDIAEVLPVNIAAFGGNKNQDSFSFEVPAGQNRVLVVISYQLSNTNNVSVVPGVEWDSVPLILLQSSLSASPHQRVGIYYRILGDSVTPTTATLERTISNNGLDRFLDAFVYENVNQVIPFHYQRFLHASASGTNYTYNPLTLERRIHARVVWSGAGRTDQPGGTSTPGAVTLATRSTGGLWEIVNQDTVQPNYTSSNTHCSLASFVLNPLEVKDQAVVAGIVEGFSGLIPGRRYFVQNTIGNIGLIPGSNTLLAGIALSETELLIK